MMDHIADGDLCSHIERAKGPLGEKVARRVFRQLIAALSYLHANNISHHDLKLVRA